MHFLHDNAASSTYSKATEQSWGLLVCVEKKCGPKALVQLSRHLVDLHTDSVLSVL